MPVPEPYEVRYEVMPNKPKSVYPSKTEENIWIENGIYTIYYSGLFWILGYVVIIPAGLVIYPWLSIEATILFFDVFTSNEWGAWFMGPFRRQLSGWMIFFIHCVLTLIPGLQLVTSPLMAWWAIADYYDYDTLLYSTYEFTYPE